ncbi:MAG: PEP-CTERM sorting domain-containing protein [Pseudomonadales bacterium]|nr:PEP-CTERM sorting domain-containing protein [Pseudomonadales bacterium]
MKKILKLAIIGLTCTFASNAMAGWVWLTDPDLGDSAINPGPANIAPAGPDSQSAGNIEAWLEDLTNSGVTYLTGGDSTPDILPGLDALGAIYIVLHYGNYQGDIPSGFSLPEIMQGNKIVQSSNVNIAYVCDNLSSCDSFNPPDEGLSNYRIFGKGPVGVPEPGTLGLLTLGLFGLVLSRRIVRR